jgi:hypothetical protein
MYSMFSLSLFKMMLLIAVACVSFAVLTLIVYPQPDGVIQTLFAQIVPASLNQSSDDSTSILNNSNNNSTQASLLLNSTGNSSSITHSSNSKAVWGYTFS